MSTFDGGNSNTTSHIRAGLTVIRIVRMSSNFSHILSTMAHLLLSSLTKWWGYRPGMFEALSESNRLTNSGECLGA